jgi:hypothetical protein
MIELYKKYEGHIKVIMFMTPLIFAIWKYVGTYIDMPEKISALEKTIHVQDSLLKVHTDFLAQDYIILKNAGLIK